MADRRRPHGLLWLIGMMGSGKSVVGRRVASRLGVPFVDTDDVVVARSGTSVAGYFAAHGEAAFRDLEATIVAELATRPDPCVIATGGGVVLRESSVEAMSRTGTVVWLAATPRVLASRVSGDATRPLLRGTADPVEPLQRLLDARGDRYAAAATGTVDTGGRTVAEVAAEVEALWTGT